MPNIQALQQAEQRKLNEKLAKERELGIAANRQEQISRLEKVRMIFDQEGWSVLRDLFLAQHAEELAVLLDKDADLTDTQLRLLRSQLQTSDTIVRLDEWVENRILSLKNKISAPKSETDGSPKGAV